MKLFPAVLMAPFLVCANCGNDRAEQHGELQPEKAADSQVTGRIDRDRETEPTVSDRALESKFKRIHSQFGGAKSEEEVAAELAPLINMKASKVLEIHRKVMLHDKQN